MTPTELSKEELKEWWKGALLYLALHGWNEEAPEAKAIEALIDAQDKFEMDKDWQDVKNELVKWMKNQKDTPPEFVKLASEHFWELIDIQRDNEQRIKELEDALDRCHEQKRLIAETKQPQPEREVDENINYLIDESNSIIDEAIQDLQKITHSDKDDWPTVKALKDTKVNLGEIKQLLQQKPVRVSRGDVSVMIQEIVMNPFHKNRMNVAIQWFKSKGIVVEGEETKLNGGDKA